MILAVAFVNGFTDAPNSVAACVSTGVLPVKKALRIAAVSDFVGSVSVGLFSGKVYEKIITLTSFDCDEITYDISVFSAMLSVVVWAVSAWYFGLPTSESHSMLAGIFGSSVAVNDGFYNINEWTNTLIGLILSVLSGFITGYILSYLMKRILKNDVILKYDKYQIVLSIFSSYMHGAQDSQKFVGLIASVLSIEYKSLSNYYFVMIICSLIISLGVLTGGERIINTIGNDMVKLDKLSGLSADISGFICLLISTLCGIPSSTTHIKTSSILGAGIIKKEININILIKLIITWILTFPVCGMLSYIITAVIIK